MTMMMTTVIIKRQGELKTLKTFWSEHLTDDEK
jgi:hypothetical protein